MRLLKPEEEKVIKAKLGLYMGCNTTAFMSSSKFYLHRDRVFVVPPAVMKMASSVPRKDIITVGTCIGKFTKTGKFRLHITCLEFLSHYAEHRVWVKPQAEMQFLYGNNIVKRHISKVTENAQSKQGVLILSPTDVPLGFGILNKSSHEIQSAKDPEMLAILNQADTGLYVRQEKEMFGLSRPLELNEHEG